jgi:hypothetical protein
MSELMRRDVMGERTPRQVMAPEDLDDIATLINLLELHARLRSESSGLGNEFD